MDNEERKRLAAERSSEVNKGNTHSSKINRLAADTLRRVLIQEEAIRLRNVTEALVAKAESGDISAIKEVFDRMDGKAVATQTVATSATTTVEMNTTALQAGSYIYNVVAGDKVATGKLIKQ